MYCHIVRHHFGNFVIPINKICITCRVVSFTGRQVEPKQASMPLIYMILIPGCALVGVAIIVLIVCCCRRRGKQAKKEYEMDNQKYDTSFPRFAYGAVPHLYCNLLTYLFHFQLHSVSPKTVTGPYYPDTIIKPDQTDSDLNLKSGIYATNLSGHPGMQNGHLGNGGELMILFFNVIQ